MSKLTSLGILFFFKLAMSEKTMLVPRIAFVSCALSAVLLTSVLAQPATAATISLSYTVDISTCTFGNVCNGVTDVPDQTLAIGDVVTATVTFANSQRLHMYDDAGGFTDELFTGWLTGAVPASSSTVTGASMTLTDLAGTLAAPLTTASYTVCCSQIGLQFNADRIATGSSISFSGYELQYTVSALTANPKTFTHDWTVFRADRVRAESVAPAPVPEPATLSLLGLGLAGAAVRRFKKRR